MIWVPASRPGSQKPGHDPPLFLSLLPSTCWVLTQVTQVSFNLGSSMPLWSRDNITTTNSISCENSIVFLLQQLTLTRSRESEKNLKSKVQHPSLLLYYAQSQTRYSLRSGGSIESPLGVQSRLFMHRYALSNP